MCVLPEKLNQLETTDPGIGLADAAFLFLTGWWGWLPGQQPVLGLVRVLLLPSWNSSQFLNKGPAFSFCSALNYVTGLSFWWYISDHRVAWLEKQVITSNWSLLPPLYLLGRLRGAKFDKNLGVEFCGYFKWPEFFIIYVFLCLCLLVLPCPEEGH